MQVNEFQNVIAMIVVIVIAIVIVILIDEVIEISDRSVRPRLHYTGRPSSHRNLASRTEIEFFT